MNPNEIHEGDVIEWKTFEGNYRGTVKKIVGNIVELTQRVNGQTYVVAYDIDRVVNDNTTEHIVEPKKEETSMAVPLITKAQFTRFLEICAKCEKEHIGVVSKCSPTIDEVYNIVEEYWYE